MEKVITGEWDGEPIWREKTLAERRAEVIDIQINQDNEKVWKI